MIVCAAGDIHGAIDRLYDEVLAFEDSLGVRFAWVLHVGDFGIWPDVAPQETRSHKFLPREHVEFETRLEAKSM